MNSVITHARVVAHALAVWNSYAGSLNQEDKDFFDACVVHVDERLPEMVLVEGLVTERLVDNGVSDDRASQLASALIDTYAQQWGRIMAPLARAE